MQDIQKLREAILTAANQHSNSAYKLKHEALAAEQEAALRLDDLVGGAGRDMRDVKGVRLKITGPTQLDNGDITRQITANRADGDELSIEWRYLALPRKFTASPLDQESIMFLGARGHVTGEGQIDVRVEPKIAIDLVEAIGGTLERYYRAPLR